ncbi:hypothetical protein [Actinokineospora xionganensis]|uniref:Uncharacterized protein n=1 Tax=Actinokineospora xionganensis TaxID=2684470 RepID=A0ABR7L1K9_9PSEU|nr:hypothetical protein [Actinokineospora xionganensis]MBC6446560.1 hypothetical protein [Actinokineospora xionganensis]
MTDRTGTTKALVLIASGVLFATAGVVCFLVALFAPTMRGRPYSGAVAFMAITVLTVALAIFLTLRGRTPQRVVLGGCATLLIGSAVAVGTLLVLIT